MIQPSRLVRVLIAGLLSMGFVAVGMMSARGSGEPNRGRALARKKSAPTAPGDPEGLLREFLTERVASRRGHRLLPRSVETSLGHVRPGTWLPVCTRQRSATAWTERCRSTRTTQAASDARSNGGDRPCRMNTYGDSFTQCHQVSDGETWQEYLAAHLGEPVRNFGVGGYGVYQAYRRMLR